MSRGVAYSRQALTQLSRIDRTTAERIVLKVEQLTAAPASLANSVKALKGGDLMRLRVGDWRVIYTETLVVIAVQRIAPRGSAHEDEVK